MNTALSYLSDAAEQGVIDRLQSYGSAQQQLEDPNYWSSVGIIALTGILVVFLILAILIAFFWLMGVVFKAINSKKKPEAPAPAPVQTVFAPQIEEADETDDDEVIAVIAAAIAAYSEQDGKSYVIKNVRRKDGGRTRSAWSAAGINENTRGF